MSEEWMGKMHYRSLSCTTGNGLWSLIFRIRVRLLIVFGTPGGFRQHAFTIKWSVPQINSFFLLIALSKLLLIKTVENLIELSDFSRIFHCSKWFVEARKNSELQIQRPADRHNFKNYGLFCTLYERGFFRNGGFWIFEKVATRIKLRRH